MSDLSLLTGPRGRRLCAALVGADHAWAVSYEHGGVRRRSPGEAAVRLEELLAGTDLTALASASDPLILIDALDHAVTAAMYWQPPDDEDALLANDAVAVTLAPVADAVATSPAAAWWTLPADLDDQHHTQFLGEYGSPPPLSTGAGAALDQWRQNARAEEARDRNRPGDPSAPYSGTWWSTPVGTATVPTTTRSLPCLGAVGLALVEDNDGWGLADVRKARVREGARVYEIAGPDAWVELVRKHPLEVTFARRHDWWRTTGRAGRWLIPDWPSVATDYDAVHLTAGAYLVTAGRPLGVDGDAATVLAGWSPDQTFWLTDAIESYGEASRWARSEEAIGGWARQRP